MRQPTVRVDGQRLAFASELKGIEAALDAADLQVDETALYDFLGYRYVPAPKTLYRNCFKLPPAHRLVYDPETGKPIVEEQELDLKPLPLIVVVVDEMADLMLVAGKEIEAATSPHFVVVTDIATLRIDTASGSAAHIDLGFADDIGDQRGRIAFGEGARHALWQITLHH